MAEPLIRWRSDIEREERAREASGEAALERVDAIAAIARAAVPERTVVEHTTHETVREVAHPVPVIAHNDFTRKQATLFTVAVTVVNIFVTVLGRIL